VPHTIVLNEELGVIVFRAKGSVHVAELVQALDDMVLIPGFKAGLSLVADFQGSVTPLTADDLRGLAAYAHRSDTMWGQTKWAILASNNLTFGLARMFMALTSMHQVTSHVFHGVIEAADWLRLGVPMDEILLRTPDQCAAPRGEA
jgi:hypothetical protein